MQRISLAHLPPTVAAGALSIQPAREPVQNEPWRNQKPIVRGPRARLGTDQHLCQCCGRVFLEKNPSADDIWALVDSTSPEPVRKSRWLIPPSRKPRRKAGWPIPHAHEKARKRGRALPYSLPHHWKSCWSVPHSLPHHWKSGWSVPHSLPHHWKSGWSVPHSLLQQWKRGWSLPCRRAVNGCGLVAWVSGVFGQRVPNLLK